MAGFDLDDLALFLLQTLPWHRISTPPPHVFALHLLFPLPFSSPPRRQANDDAHGYFPPEDFQDLRPVRQVLMRK